MQSASASGPHAQSYGTSAASDVETTEASAECLQDYLRRFDAGGHHFLFLRPSASGGTPPGPPREDYGTVRRRSNQGQRGFDEEDLPRPLIDTGLAECSHARAWIAELPLPVCACFASEAARARSTSEQIAAPAPCFTLPHLHPAGFRRDVSSPGELAALRVCEEAFAELGPAPLCEYDEWRPELAGALSAYATRVLLELLPKALPLLESSGGQPGVVAVVGHAVFIAAVARGCGKGLAELRDKEPAPHERPEEIYQHAADVIAMTLRDLDGCNLRVAEGLLVGGDSLVRHCGGAASLGTGNKNAKCSTGKNSGGTLEALRSFCLRNFLILGLSFALLFGLVVPVVGSTLSSCVVKLPIGAPWPVFATLAVVCLFIVNGLGLNTDEVKKALRNWPSVLYGVVSILLITPWISIIPLKLGYLNPGLAAGFAVFNSMPTTLSSGVNLVNQCEGNSALALILTVSTNLLGIVTAPFILSIILGAGGIDLSPLPLLGTLSVTILLPLLCGKVARDTSKTVSGWVKKHKVKLSLLQQFCVVFIAWMKLSDSAQLLTSLVTERPLDLLLVLATGGVIHGIFLVANVGAASALRLATPEQRAVVLLCSEKAFPVAVTVISFLDPAQVGDTGLLIIPCVTSHFTQLFWDAALVTRWAGHNAARKAAAATSGTSVGAGSTGQVDAIASPRGAVAGDGRPYLQCGRV